MYTYTIYIYPLITECICTISTPVNTHLNLTVPEECQRTPATPSLLQHLEFICRPDKHKYSHIILRKSLLNCIAHSLLSEIRRAIFCLYWQDNGDRPLEMTFLPADCKGCYVTTEHLLKVGKRGEERKEKIEIRLPAALLPSSINVDIWECFISCQNVVLNPCHWHCGSEAELWKTDLNVSHAFFFRCLGFPNQTWRETLIFYINDKHVHALMYTHTHKSRNESKTVR